MMSSARSASRLAAFAIATGLLIALPAAPTVAATSTVTNLAELQAALADCATAPNTITLGANITAATSQLIVSCDTTLELASYDVAVSNIVINAGVEFVVAGPTDGTGGTLTADPAAARSTAAIRTSGATLTVTGGTVNAWGFNGAGIGGDRFARDAGTLNVAGGIVNARSSGYAAAVGGSYLAGSGGTVTVSAGVLNASSRVYAVAVGGGGAGSKGNGGAGATVTVTGGTVNATVDDSSTTAIGGGLAGYQSSDRGGPGGSLTIGESGVVVIDSAGNAFGSGLNISEFDPNGDFGSLTVDGVLRLPSGRLWVGTDPATEPEVTVGATGRILGSTADPAVGGEIAGPGTIDNQGAITLAPTGVVTGNNKLVQFVPPTPSRRVFAPSFQTGARTLPTPPTGTQWNTAADGSGSWFTTTSSTAGSGTLNLYSVAPATIVVSTDPAELAATAGEAFDFPVVVNGPDGTALSPQPAIDYTSTDCTIGAGGVFTVARSCSITASTTVQGVPLQKIFTIQVVPGELAELAISPAADTVTQGASVAFLVTGEDAEGNPVDVDAAVLTSSAAADAVDGRAVTFSGAGTRTVTASLSGTTTTATVDVTAGPLATLSLTPPTASVVQGGTQEFTVSGADSAGNPVDASEAVLTSSNAADTVSGRTVTFSGAGSRVITATQGSVTATSTVTVTAGPVAALTITPSAETVAQGGRLTFQVTAEDAAGNPVDPSGAVLTSSVATDVVSGFDVTFPHASPHTITATLDGVSASVTVEVVPAPAPVPGPGPAPAPVGLANTGSDGGAAAVIGVGALGLVLVGGVLVLARRRTRA